MTVLAQQLDDKLATWRPETATEVARMVSELIEWADSDALDLMSGPGLFLGCPSGQR